MLLPVTLARALRKTARPLWIVGILGVTLTPAGAAEQKLPWFDPDLDHEAAGSLTLSGTTWTHADPTHTVHLRQVDASERLRYVEGASGMSVDPFASPPGEDPRFMSFLIVVENTGEEILSFNALACWLTTNRQQIETPLGLTDLSFDYQVMGLSLPVAYERIAPLLLEGTHTLPPGASVSGLLIYHAVDVRTRRFHVDVELIGPAGDPLRFSAPYRRPPKVAASGESEAPSP